MKRNKKMMRKRRNNLGSAVFISIIAVIILLIIVRGSNQLKERKAELEKREDYLVEQIDAQRERSEEIEEYRKYTHTMQYIEDMAKERLGLVNKDEIIFEADN